MASNQKNKEQVIIFSHGMGLRKDNRGLFTELAEISNKNGIATVFFDYHKYNPKTHEVTVESFSESVKVLQGVIDSTIKKYPNSKITIIAQSQGGIIATLCDLKPIFQLIAISPFFHTKMSDILRRYTKSPDNEVNFTGISRRIRTDGTITLLMPNYWKERFEIDPISKFNEAALNTNLTLICPLQDEIMDYTDLRQVKYARIINIDGNHDFTKEYRRPLIDTVLQELN